jgi:hypothetical protein
MMLPREEFGGLDFIPAEVGFGILGRYTSIELSLSKFPGNIGAWLRRKLCWQASII